MLRRQALRERVDVRGRLLQVAGPLRGHDHDRQRAVGLQTVVEEAQRFRDPAGAHVVVARHRLVAHGRSRVARRVLAEGERDVGEVVACAAVFVHVTAREQRDLVDGTDHTERPRPLTAVGEPGLRLGPRAARRIGALAGPPRDRHGALTGRDGHRRLAHDPAAGAAAEPDLREPRDLAEPDVAGHVDLTIRLHRVRGDAVDLRRMDARVVERTRDRLARERELGVGQSLAERGLPDAGDRGLVLDQATRRLTSHPLTSPSNRAAGARGTMRHLLSSLRSRC